MIICSFLCLVCFCLQFVITWMTCFSSVCTIFGTVTNSRALCSHASSHFGSNSVAVIATVVGNKFSEVKCS